MLLNKLEKGEKDLHEEEVKKKKKNLSIVCGICDINFRS